jgi:hypothetical protein
VVAQWDGARRIGTLEDKIILVNDINLRASVPFKLSGSSYADISDCLTSRFIAEVPGGRKEMAEMGQDRVNAIAREAGRVCGFQFTERGMNAMEWTSKFRDAYSIVCSARLGGENAEYCACRSREAEKRFAGPSVFTRFEAMPAEELPSGAAIWLRYIELQCAGSQHAGSMK